MKITLISFFPFFFAILHPFPCHVGLRRVGSGLTITVPMDTMSVAAATAVVSIANVTMRLIITETLGTGPSVELAGVPVLPVAALEVAHQGPV